MAYIGIIQDDSNIWFLIWVHNGPMQEELRELRQHKILAIMSDQVPLEMAYFTEIYVELLFFQPSPLISLSATCRSS